MLEKDILKDYGEIYFFCQYILHELKKSRENRQFIEYLDVFPESVEQFPIFYSGEALVYLEGSPFLE